MDLNEQAKIAIALGGGNFSAVCIGSIICHTRWQTYELLRYEDVAGPYWTVTKLRNDDEDEGPEIRVADPLLNTIIEQSYQWAMGR